MSIRFQCNSIISFHKYLHLLSQPAAWNQVFFFLFPNKRFQSIPLFLPALILYFLTDIKWGMLTSSKITRFFSLRWFSWSLQNTNQLKKWGKSQTYKMSDQKLSDLQLSKKYSPDEATVLFQHYFHFPKT